MFSRVSAPRGGTASTRVNRRLIAAHALGRPGVYTYVDRTARAGRSYVYRLQIVRGDGTLAWAGSAVVRVARR